MALVMSKERLDHTKAISLSEIRVLFLNGFIPWDTYQHFEQALSPNFGTENKFTVVSPLVEERSKQ